MEMKEQGELLRDEGMAKAAKHAGKWWTEYAYAYALMFVTSATEEFTTEDLRNWATAQGLNEPPDRRAWGSVMHLLSRRRIIKRTGYRTHKDPSRHRAVSAVWRTV